MIVWLLVSCSLQTEAPSFVPATADPSAVSLSGVDNSDALFEVTVTTLAHPDTSMVRVQTATASPNGRPELDDWRVHPSGMAVDPSAYWEDQRPTIGGGQQRVSAGEAASFALPMGAELRFVKSGTATVQLTTRRTTVDAVSAPFEFEVRVPSDAEAAARSDALLAELASKLDPESVVNLALIGHPSSLAPAIRGITSDSARASIWSVVLHAHPDRKAALAAIEQAMAAPEVPVTRALLEAHAAVRYNLEFSSALDLDADASERARRGLVIASNRHEALDALAAAVAPDGAKRGEALTSALDILLSEIDSRLHPPAWTESVRTYAAANAEALRPETLQRQLYARNPLPIPPERLAVLAREDGPGADAALMRLWEVDPPMGVSLAVERLQRAHPVSTDRLERQMLTLDIPPAELEAFFATLDGSDVRRLRIAAAHGVGYGDVFATLLETAPTEIETSALAAMTAGLLNAGHPAAEAALARYGEEHASLLLEAGPLVRDHSELFARARAGLQIGGPEAMLGAAEYLAEFGPEQEAKALATAFPGLPESRQAAVAWLLTTGRGWLVDGETAKRLASASTNAAAKRVWRTSVFATGQPAPITALRHEGEWAIRLNQRLYIGAAEIKEKLGQLEEGRKVMFAFLEMPTSEADRYVAWATEVGLVVIVAE